MWLFLLILYRPRIYRFPATIVFFQDPRRKRWIEVSLYLINIVVPWPENQDDKSTGLETEQYYRILSMHLTMASINQLHIWKIVSVCPQGGSRMMDSDKIWHFRHLQNTVESFWFSWISHHRSTFSSKAIHSSYKHSKILTVKNACGSSVHSGMGYTFSALVYWYKKVNVAKLGKQYLFFFLWHYSPISGLGLPPWNFLFHFSLLVLRQSVGLLGRVVNSSTPYTNIEKWTHIHKQQTLM
jgi:hypothetical protein